MTWRDLTLGEALRVKHGFAFRGEFFAPEGQHMVVTPGNFLESGGFRVRPGKERFYTGDFPEEYVLSKDDLIVAMTEQGEGLLGSAARIPDDEKFLHNQRIGLISITDATLLHKRFMYWLFNSRPVRGQLRGSATGAKVKHTAPERIYKVKIRAPSVDDQAYIAETLDAYDDLIETNRRRIALLEESARLLYREWFVKLCFPGHDLVVKVDGVPVGWCPMPFSSVAEFINGFAFKPAHQLTDGLPIVKIPELRDGISEKTPKNPGYEIPDRNKITSGDLLFSWSGTLLVNEWAEGPALLNQHLFKVVPNDIRQRRLIRFALENAIPSLMGHVVGATMQHIRRGVLDEQKMLVPDERISELFAVIVDPIIDQALLLREQNKVLVSARDAFLPKLMSGQLSV